MTDQQRQIDELEVIEGTDAGALGIGEPPVTAPPGAVVDGAERDAQDPDGDDEAL